MSIYFDNAATTPVLPCAKEAFLAATESFANPSSLHSAGLAAEKLLEASRRTILNVLGSHSPKDGLVFCGSGTEANNLAICGVAHSKRFFSGKRIITSDSEHPSVNNSAEALKNEGFDVVKVSTAGGVVDEEAFAALMTKDTFLVSIMTVNNESGAVYDISSLCKTAKAINPEVIFHTDATQAFMKVKLSVQSLKADLITVSAHKIGGFKGVGALYIKEDIIRKKAVTPVIYGGGQENGLRSGTENIPGISAFAAAAQYRFSCLNEDTEKIKSLRDYIVAALEGTEIKINTAPVYSPAIISLTLPGIKSEVMLHFLSAKGIFVSSGSACSSHHPGISSAMTAYGLSPGQADSTLRVSLCADNTIEEADVFIAAIKEGINTLIRKR